MEKKSFQEVVRTELEDTAAKLSVNSYRKRFYGTWENYRIKQLMRVGIKNIKISHIEADSSDFARASIC